MIYAFRTSTYARNIYIYGVTSFASIDQEYVQPVKEFAALHYTKEQIQNALDNGWITTDEYNNTMVLMSV
jgi:ribulose bisphosphate carboxylase small subunit